MLNMVTFTTDDFVSDVSFYYDVKSRFGLVPNFFTLGNDAQTLRNLWRDVEYHYLDSPFPARFKEMLFVYLSSFCSSSYCISRHLGFLVGLGKIEGLADCPVEPSEVLALLRRKPPRLREMIPVMETLNARLPLRADQWDETCENELMACCTYIFRQGREHRAVARSLSRFLGARRYTRLAGFLGCIKTAHSWTETHPELLLEDDVLEFLADHELGDWISKHFAPEVKELPQVEIMDLVQHTSDIIQSVAADGRYLFVNQAWHEILGYSADEVCSLNVFDVIHPEHQVACKNKMAQIMQGRQIFIETIFQAKDGHSVHVEGNASCRFESGSPVATRGFFRDVTERKRVERERDKLIEQLQVALRQVQALSRLLPVCSWCSRIQRKDGGWESVLDTLQSEPAIKISHGICPDCTKGLEDQLALEQ